METAIMSEEAVVAQNSSDESSHISSIENTIKIDNDISTGILTCSSCSNSLLIPEKNIVEAASTISTNQPPQEDSSSIYLCAASFTSYKSFEESEESSCKPISESPSDQFASVPSSSSDITNEEVGKGDGNATSPASLHMMLECQRLRLTEEDDEKLDEFYVKFGAIFTPIEIDEALDAFIQYDINANGIMLNELKLLLEKLQVPQTHLVAKGLMAQVAGNHEDHLTFGQFLDLYAQINRSKSLELQKSRDLENAHQLAQAKTVEVAKEGVQGAKQFFEAKIAQHQADSQSCSTSSSAHSSIKLRDVVARLGIGESKSLASKKHE